jgi:selenocysteine-specific elongation factor
MLPVSAFSGQGMAALTAELGRLARQIPERSAEALARLPLDRVFTMRGFGTVVTGTLLAGTIEVGDALVLQPANRKVRDALAKLHAQMQALRGQSMDVARFKKITGLSRKYAIPLLEHLDRERVTCKQGQTRLVL